MFDRRSLALAGGVAFFVVAAAQPAQARLNELIRLVHSPIGRFIFKETPEGAMAAKAFLGRTTGRIGYAERGEMIQRLALKENRKLAAQLEKRLLSIESDFKMFVQMQKASSPERLLNALARQRLRVASRVETREMVFVPYESAKRMADMRREFIEAVSAEGVELTKVGADLRAQLRLRMGQGLDANGADLRFADLRGTQLSGSSLKETQLAWADLSGAYMEGAQLVRANLRNASLRDKTILTNADLTGADLRGADLTGARLQYAVLRNADLRGADLREVHWTLPGFRRADDLSAEVAGALFNKSTKLPFSREQAERLGMIYVP